MTGRPIWPLLLAALLLAGCAKRGKAVCDHTRDGERCQESGRDPQFSCVAGQCVDTSLVRKQTSNVPRAVLHTLQSGKGVDAYALGKKGLLASELQRRYKSPPLMEKLWTSRILPALQRVCREEIQRLLQQGEVSTAAAIYQRAAGPVIIDSFTGIKAKSAAREKGLPRFSLGAEGAPRLFHHVLQHAAHLHRKGRHHAAYRLIHQVSTGVEPVDTWEKADLNTRKELLEQIFSAGAMVARFTSKVDPMESDLSLVVTLQRDLWKSGYWLVIDTNAPGSPRTLKVNLVKRNATLALLDASGKQLFAVAGKFAAKGLALELTKETMKKLTDALVEAKVWKRPAG